MFKKILASLRITKLKTENVLKQYLRIHSTERVMTSFRPLSTRLPGCVCSFPSPRGKPARAQWLPIPGTLLLAVGGTAFRKCRSAEVRACVLKTVAANQSSRGSEFVKERVRRAFSLSGKADGRRSRRDLSHPPPLKRVSELEKKGGDAQARPERN